MNISPTIISGIKEISIIDVALALGINVKNNKAFCILGHDRKTPSLSFSKKKGLYYCFGCGIRGDSISLVQTVFSKEFKDACTWILERFHIGNIPHIEGKVWRPVKNKIQPNEKVLTSDYEADVEIYEWIINQSSLSNIAFNYLHKERGFKKETVEMLSIRDLVNPKKFFSSLREHWGQDRLVKCGLLKIGENGTTKPVWWDHIILFPFTNLNFRTDYLQGRRFSAEGAKYVNLSGVTPSIFNLHRLGHVNPGGNIFLCEGVPDTISGIELNLDAFGILGARGFKTQWVDYFREYKIFVIPDKDKAGELFVADVRTKFKKIGKEVKTLQLPPEFKDLNEYYRRNHITQ